MPASEAMLMVGMALTLASLGGLWWAGRQQPRPLDRACAGVALSWLAWLLAHAWLMNAAAQAVPAVPAALARLGYQGMLSCAALLVWPAASRLHSLAGLSWLGFTLVGALLALAAGWPALQQFAQGWGLPADRLWMAVNMLGTVLVALSLARALRGQRSTKGWMALLVALSALGMLMSDWQSNTQPWAAAGRHFFFFVALFAFWIATRSSDEERPPQVWMHRRELAQELHDGVGSQLVSILSSLDTSSPQQRRTAHALQGCLIELKLLTDGLDADACLMSHLASLRYRMDPLLGDAGIDMQWLLINEARLSHVRGNAAKHVLRLTQEALANVLHHSGARSVTVLCQHRLDTDSLLLCVADDGRGFVMGQGASQGKGLNGMRWRAQLLGGRLRIEASAERGTLVQLVVPMALLDAGAHDAAADRASDAAHHAPAHLLD